MMASNAPTSPTSSHPESFSVISSPDRGSSYSSDRERQSSGQSFQIVNGGSSAAASSGVLSDDDDFILIPAGSTALQARIPPSPSASRRSVLDLVVPVQCARQERVEAVEEEASGSADETSSSDAVETDTSEGEEEARSDQRRRRVADDSDSEGPTHVPTLSLAGLSLGPATRSASASTSSASISTSQASSSYKGTKYATVVEKRRAKKQRRKERESLKREPDVATSSDVKFSGQVYKDAVAFITQYLSDPPKKPATDARLHFLQSLIIELGVLSDGKISLPISCKAAKQILKTHVHINVGQYLATRNPSQSASSSGLAGDGPAKFQAIMYPSKKALVKSLNKNTIVGRETIKGLGLNPLMVMFHH